METRLLHLSHVRASTGLPEDFVNPIKPERFVGKHEGRLGILVGMTQFGVNHVLLELGFHVRIAALARRRGRVHPRSVR